MNLQLLILVVSGALCLSGCQSGSEVKNDAGPTDEKTDAESKTLVSAVGAMISGGNSRVSASLVAQSRPILVDVPVPQGFKLVEAVSRVYETPVGRFADHVYLGQADKNLVHQFYKEQMVFNNWKIESSRNVRGQITTEFSKGAERCGVQISESKGQTQVWITIMPQKATTP